MGLRSGIGASFTLHPPWRTGWLGVMTTPSEEAARRRTFAIISHPDAGKTTLTEKFLLYGGALSSEAGAVKGRGNQRGTTSDWMELERQRGISVTSTVLSFPYRDLVLNLLDTPGHRDFSEDTYRVLAAADAAIMVLDAAKGIEAQTFKLFEVCRRDGRAAADLHQQVGPAGSRPARPAGRDRVEAGSAGRPGHLAGRDRRRLPGRHRPTHRRVHALHPHRPRRHQGPRGGGRRGGRHVRGGRRLDRRLRRARAPRRRRRRALDRKAFLAGESSPTFFGSALTNFGVGALLDAVADLAPAARTPRDVDGEPWGLDEPLSGFVFKVQANMDPNHRDRIAYFRVCSGEFDRGVTLTHAQTGKPVATKYAHSVFGAERETVDTAYPGDVVGLVGASALRVGDTIFARCPVEFPGIPAFAPEHFQTARPADIGRFKQFRTGIAQLDEEGVIQVLRDPDLGDQAPVLAAVGPMQFDVASHRLENEFGAPARLESTSWKVARRTDEESEAELRRMPGTTVLHRADGTLLALFENPFWLERLASDHPELMLEKLPAQ